MDKNNTWQNTQLNAQTENTQTEHANANTDPETLVVNNTVIGKKSYSADTAKAVPLFAVSTALHVYMESYSVVPL